VAGEWLRLSPSEPERFAEALRSARERATHDERGVRRAPEVKR
jgi:hypothetical protein